MKNEIETLYTCVYIYINRCLCTILWSMDAKRRGRSMKASAGTTPCIPRRLKSNRKIANPTTLLERLRDVVLRLIMFSAISSKTTSRTSTRSRSETSPVSRPCRHHDSYRSEAVEECIEFFKRSAGNDEGDGAKSSSVSEDSVDVVMRSLTLSSAVDCDSNDSSVECR